MQVCNPVFPLKVFFETPDIDPAQAHKLIALVQQALNDRSDFPAHRLQLVDSRPAAKTAREKTGDLRTEIRGGLEFEGADLTVKLFRDAVTNSPYSFFARHTSVLELGYPDRDLPLQSRPAPDLIEFIAHNLEDVFAEERALLSHLLSTTASSSRQNESPHDQKPDLERRSARTLKYAPNYHLTFSLFSEAGSPSDWEIQSALEEYIKPVLALFSPISNFTVDTQVQLYATLPSSIQQPMFDAAAETWTLRHKDLSGFVNAAEWPLSPSIGTGPTVNFLAYVPKPEQSPLVIEGGGGTSWLIPQWGGIAIVNSPKSSLSTADLHEAMSTFRHQLLSLLGLPDHPKDSLQIRLSTLTRIRTAQLLLSAASTLASLARLTHALPSIAIPKTVAAAVAQTLLHLHSACDSMRDGEFQAALEAARVAEAAAEKAFFEPSMVGQLYFPDEHKVAVYLPLLGPCAVPLIMATLKELRSIFKKPR